MSISTSEQTTRIGYYSAEMAREIGYCVYLNRSGERVMVTGVVQGNRPLPFGPLPFGPSPFKPLDLVEVGPVTKFITRKRGLCV